MNHLELNENKTGLTRPFMDEKVAVNEEEERTPPSFQKAIVAKPIRRIKSMPNLLEQQSREV